MYGEFNILRKVENVVALGNDNLQLQALNGHTIIRSFIFGCHKQVIKEM